MIIIRSALPNLIQISPLNSGHSHLYPDCYKDLHRTAITEQYITAFDL
jgi:hypothetical protein